MIAYLAALVALAGLLMYVLASNAKVQECGRLLFFVGVFFTVSALAGRTVKLF